MCLSDLALKSPLIKLFRTYTVQKRSVAPQSTRTRGIVVSGELQKLSGTVPNVDVRKLWGSPNLNSEKLIVQTYKKSGILLKDGCELFGQ